VNPIQTYTQVKEVNNPVSSLNQNNGYSYGQTNEAESTGFKKKK